MTTSLPPLIPSLPPCAWGKPVWEPWQNEHGSGVFFDRALCNDSKGRVYRAHYWKHRDGWERFWTAADEVSPQIRCQCGGEAFALHYGSYEINATCTACGACETVYDG